MNEQQLKDIEYTALETEEYQEDGFAAMLDIKALIEHIRELQQNKPKFITFTQIDCLTGQVLGEMLVNPDKLMGVGRLLFPSKTTVLMFPYGYEYIKETHEEVKALLGVL